MQGLVNDARGLLRWLSGKEPACQCKRCGFDLWLGKDPLETEMTTHSSVLAWEIPWTEEPCGYSPQGGKRFEHN